MGTSTVFEKQASGIFAALGDRATRGFNRQKIVCFPRKQEFGKNIGIILLCKFNQ